MASILANTSISLVARAVGLFAGLAITALLSRVLGVDQFGQYALVLSFGAILHVVTDWGLYLTLTREIARSPDQAQHLLAATAGLRLAIFAAVFAVGMTILAMVPSYTNLLLLYAVAAAGFLFQSLSQLLMGVFQERGTVWKALFGDLAGRLVQLIIVSALAGGLIGAATGGGLLVAMSAFTAGAALAYGMHAAFVPAVSAWKVSFQPKVWRAILKQSWPIGIMLILNAIYFRIDIIMLSLFRPGLEVGWYGLAYRVVESGLFLPAAFGGLLLPKLSAASQKRRSKLVNEALFAILVVGALLFVLLAGAATPIVVLFAGSAFAPAGSLLAILTAALITMFFGNIFGFTLVAIGRQRILLYLYAALAVFNVIANWIVIPKVGAVGAAWTTVATEALAASAAAIIVHRYVRYALPRRYVFAAVAAAAGSATVLGWMVPIVPVVIALAIAAGTFLALATLFGLIRRSYVTLLLEP